MSNLSKIRRDKMIEFLETLKEQHSDDESLIAISQIEKELVSKRYGLVWEEHEEAVDVMMRDNIPVFTEVKEREICMVPGEDYNFLLEGDNLHSLHLLEKTHKGRIQMIYIDPPYNTGNKDFTYDDMLIDGMDGYRHSKWLSFIALRLKLAKALLTEEGLIFISIDDNEMANLKLLCDEIFGEVNYVANIIVKSNPRGSQSKKEIASLNEYILVYAKDIRYSAIIGHKLTDDMVSEYKCSDAKGAYRLLGLRQRGGFWRASERPNLFYPFYVNTKNASISLIEDKSHNTAIYPIQPSTGEKGTWRWSKEKAEKEIELLVAKEVKRGQEIVWDIYQKDYMGSDGGIRRTKAKSLWDEKEVNYQNAANELKDIFGISPFTYAKPSYLIKRAMEMIDFSKNSIVLDFFAGSGTTAQAVLELNKEDGGQRKFILCTNNENNICEEITYQRIKTVITGKRQDGSEYSEGIPANLKYYHTDFVHKSEEYLSDALMNHIKEMIQLEHGVRIDDDSYIMIMSDDEADELEKKWNEYTDIKAIYVSQDVLLTASQEALFGSVDTYIIPDYYFNFELREAGELW